MEKTEPTVELLQKILETEKKQLRCDRFRLWLGIIGVLLAVLSLVLLLTGMFWMKGQIETLSAAVRETAEKINEVADSVNAIDFGALEKSYATLAQSATEMIGTIKESTSGLKDIMDNAEIAMEKLSAIDIEALNDGIRELNSILKPMSQFFGLFRN